jgi:hypothetical protein
VSIFLAFLGSMPKVVEIIFLLSIGYAGYIMLKLNWNLLFLPIAFIAACLVRLLAIFIIDFFNYDWIITLMNYICGITFILICLKLPITTEKINHICKHLNNLKAYAAITTLIIAACYSLIFLLHDVDQIIDFTLSFLGKTFPIFYKTFHLWSLPYIQEMTDIISDGNPNPVVLFTFLYLIIKKKLITTPL